MIFQKIISVFLFLIISVFSYGQIYYGKVLDIETNKPIEFINIGIIGKQIGTITDENGNFKITIDNVFSKESLLFSSISYEDKLIKISELKQNKIIFLQKKIYELNEIVIHPKNIKLKHKGIKTKTKTLQTGFKNNKLGFECGLLFKNKKTAFLKKVNFNIATCTYDTIFYRLNVYTVDSIGSFVNILKKPIYIQLPKNKIGDKISIDLSKENIIVNHNFLITLEHVKDLGKGLLYFSASVLRKTYFRKTSQAKWETISVGISMNIEIEIEQ